MSWEDAMKSSLFRKFREVTHDKIENKTNVMEKIPI